MLDCILESTEKSWFNQSVVREYSKAVVETVGLGVPPQLHMLPCPSHTARISCLTGMLSFLAQGVSTEQVQRDLILLQEEHC